MQITYASSFLHFLISLFCRLIYIILLQFLIFLFYFFITIYDMESCMLKFSFQELSFKFNPSYEDLYTGKDFNK